MDEPVDSVTQWLRQTEEGQESAVGKLWERYFVQVLNLTRSRFGNMTRQIDSEDLAATVLTSFFLGLRAGRIDTVQNREHLWNLLELIARRRATDLVRRVTTIKRRGVNSQFDEPCEEPLFHDLIDSAHSPQVQAEINDELTYLLSKLKHDYLHQIVRLKLEGHTNPEIAHRLNKSLSSIERKLRLIREIWMREIPS